MDDSAGTLQTTAPLAELRIEHTARAIYWFQQLADDEDVSQLDVDQPYQRGHAWGLQRRRLLIRSLMLGVPIGAITVNDRFAARFLEPAYGLAGEANRNWATAIIDGKQRFTTFVMWMRGELSVPASWFEPSEIIRTVDTEDGPYVHLTDLVDRQRRFFGNKPVAVVSAKVKTLAEEREIFDLINFGGVDQGSSD